MSTFNYAHEKYIEWYATGNMLTYSLDEHKVVKRSTLASLARELGYSRQAMYRWPGQIPNFEERVKKAREALIIQNIGSVWNAVYLSAIKGDNKAMILFLSTYDPNFKLRSKHAQMQRNESTSWVNLLQESLKRQAREQTNSSL